MDNSIYLIPGMTVKVELYNDLGNESNGEGYHITTDTTRELGGTIYTLTKGFAVIDPEVGELTEEASKPHGKTDVYYTHKKPEKNTIICFLAKKNETITLDIITVPIHDHSSIVQGGPA